ncbi:hypothetical protein MUY14_46115 [Amycolatopsis sp. FBCC-B4732]|uniref:hypothetical protein n=1 Tax=Amycolatopsis sp. FBCC-B4732 TaxID=3079339 RepID=UPI001FF46140|nr:hypothetical protein [Amycolatopsis sp. FBCC-B4732]UOX88961.1 hypothetical protein MUY14_46115 [Amycolatopsis sp. FBCC-B4732]
MQDYTNGIWKAADPADPRTLICQYVSFVNADEAEVAFGAMVKIKKGQPGDAVLMTPPNIGRKAVIADSGAHWVLAEKAGFVVDLE